MGGGCARPGANRQSPIGTGYSKMFVFQTKVDYMVVEGQAYT
jgi:hypothetical protein